MPVGGRFGDKVGAIWRWITRGGDWVAAKNTRVAWVGKESKKRRKGGREGGKR
jgi:hypothetical protein